MNMEEYLIDLPVCRICFEASIECIEIYAYVDMESDHYDSQTYLECLELCINLDVKVQDGQPRHICSSCSAELLAAVAFIRKAKNSYNLLLDNAFQVKTEDEKDSKAIDVAEEDGETESILYANDNESLEEEEEQHHINVVEDANSVQEIKHNEEFVQISSLSNENITEDNENIIMDSENIIMDDENGLSEEEVSICEFDEEYNEVSEILHICNLCPLSYEKLEDLKQHGEECHVDQMFCCVICFHRFSSKLGLSNHLKSEHSNVNYAICRICGESVERTSLRSHKKNMHRKSSYLCTACPRIFKTLTGLQIHTETHNENRQRNFECKLCLKKFLTERTYKVHLRTHRDREQFQCSLCDKKFLQKINLKLHMQMHRGETMDCMYCEKKFVRKMDLTIHMRFHTGNFPYECQHCDKRFAIVSHLNYHAKRHQGFMYKCEVCGKEFINKSGLRNHSFQHTVMPFNCTLCDKGFPTRFKIKRHLKTVHHVEDNDDLDHYITKTDVKLEQLEEQPEDELMHLFNLKD